MKDIFAATCSLPNSDLLARSTFCSSDGAPEIFCRHPTAHDLRQLHQHSDEFSACRSPDMALAPGAIWRRQVMLLRFWPTSTHGNRSAQHTLHVRHVSHGTIHHVMSKVGDLEYCSCGQKNIYSTATRHVINTGRPIHKQSKQLYMYVHMHLQVQASEHVFVCTELRRT
jgi:hypothetical protein